MKIPLVLLLGCGLLGNAAATTFTVSNTSDSGAGSLRQAIIDANAHANSANPGNAADIIAFAIGGSGVKTISPGSSLPTITEAVVIDGYSQPGARANTLTSGNNAVLLIELNGSSAGAGVAGLTLSGGGSTIRGLVINRFGTFGIQVNSGAGGHTLQGNFIGTDPSGQSVQANLNSAIDITGSPGNLIGGATPDAGNVLSGNFGDGIYIHPGAGNNTIQGNRIGTNPAGTAVVLNTGQIDQSNTGDGIILESSGNLVGGTATGARNIVAGSSGDAIDIQASVSGNVIQGNSIGTDATGTLKLGNPGGAGVRVSDSTNNIIGGALAGEGNLIADNYLGIQIDNFFAPATGNHISGNAIFSSRHGIGIDLDTLAGSSDDVTPNDTGDGDAGANNFQNFPVITSATYNGNRQLQIAGTLNSMSSQSYQVELFGNFAPNSSGYGEGHYFLGSVTLNTNGSGNGSFSTTVSSFAPVNFVSATATDAAGNTSEFAQDLAVTNAKGRLVNLAARAHVMTGGNVTIGGFIIAGKFPKRVILRGLGPSLPASVPNRLADPVLNLFDASASTPIATNNDWKSNQAEVMATSLAPTNDLESAIVITLAPGVYTVELSGNGGGTGVGLMEIYDVTPDSDSGLFNAAARTLVESGDNVLIGGLTIGGTGSMAFVVDAKGPSLGIGGTLADPTLALYDASGTQIAFNDDWQSDINQSQIPAILRPGDVHESALYRVLAPGTYTAIVRGNGPNPGIALIEIYDVN